MRMTSPQLEGYRMVRFILRARAASSDLSCEKRALKKIASGEQRAFRQILHLQETTLTFSCRFH